MILISKSEKLRKALQRKLLSQYLITKIILEKRKISTKGIPMLEVIKGGLTNNVLDKALKLEKPILNLIPPVSLKSIVDAIDNYKIDIQKYNTCVYNLKDSNLWNGGKAKIEKKWRVIINEGVQNVKADPLINNGKKNNFQVATEWLRKLKNQGLDVMNDANSYLILMIKALEEGKPLDTKTNTILNAKNLTKTSLIVGGDWSGTEVGLGFIYPCLFDISARLRGSIPIDILI